MAKPHKMQITAFHAVSFIFIILYIDTDAVPGNPPSGCPKTTIFRHKISPFLSLHN